MEQKIHKSFLVIEKVKRATSTSMEVDTRECLARIPFENGTHQTERGVLSVAFHAIDDRNRTKMILSGDVVPTVQKRGKPGQFRQRDEPRRVVEFPLIPGGFVKQELSTSEYLLFRKEEVVYTAG